MAPEKTVMDKTFDAPEAEARITQAWDKARAFAAGANAKPGQPAYSIVIPPPNVTGSLHIGHAFNNTLQDILIRWKRMQGFDVLWQPGTDHAGIATQMVTEREMAANGEPTRAEMGREAFLARVWAQKRKSRGTIIGQLKRLGCSCDWEREAFTMGGAPGDPDPTKQNFHDAVIRVFVEMYNKGLIYRGKRLVNWDPHFETAISDLEVENIETPGHMWHFKYPLAGGATYEYVEKDEEGTVTLRETRDYISIATTRPETMLGDGAVAVHPSDARYSAIVGQLCEIPVGPKEHRRLIPIITDEYPDPTFGSGAVKITGAHDFNDYGVAKRNEIPCYRLMDPKARMRADGAPYAEAAAIAQAVANGKQTLTEAETDALNLVPEAYRGLDRLEARAAVVAAITAEGLAVTYQDEDGETHPLVENKPIMQPFGDRSKVVIEPMLTDQWFVDADKIVGPALEAVRSGQVKILPESGEKTYYHWLENIEPWCISRQLWWGHQIPVWYLPKIELTAGSKRIDDASLDFSAPLHFCAVDQKQALAQIERYLREHGIEYDFFHGGYTNPVTLQQEFEANGGVPVWRDPDVLDTWFSSGLWPIGTLGWPDQTPEMERYFPTSVLVTGQDILFFWVARMMMMQIAVVDQVPFHEVYLHGLVRDAKGKKMSKSVGNVVDPLEVIDAFGADALRFSSAAMAALGGVLKLDMQRIQGYRNFGTKLWNAVRFAEMNEAVGPTHAPRARPTPKATVNAWIIGETARVRETVDAALAEYRFNDAANALYAFVWGKVCDWYVEFSKPLLQGEDAAARAETQATMAWVLDQCMILLHPIMPFITEELWGLTATRATLCAHAEWPADLTAALVDPEADAEMTWVIAFIEGIRSARAQMNVPAGLYIPVLRLSGTPAEAAAYAANAALIDRMARIESLADAEAAPKGAISVIVGGAEFALPLADIIDVAQERGRLEKNLGKLEKEIKGLAGRANNPKFADSAPPEVVEETKANLAAREEEADVIRAALARLAELG